MRLLFVLTALLSGSCMARADDARARALTAQLEVAAATRPLDLSSELPGIEAALVDASAPVRRDILLRLRRLQRDSGDFKSATAINTRLRALGTQYKDQVALAQAELGDIDDLLRTYDYSGAKARKLQMEQRFDLASMPEVNFNAQMSFGRLYLLNSEYERTLAHFTAGRQLAERLPNPDPARAEVLMNLAQLYHASKDPQEALRHLDAAERYTAAMRPRMRSNLHFTRAMVLVGLAQHGEALAAFQRSLEIARASGIHVMEAHVLGNMADLALRRQRWLEAEQLAREALAVSQRIHDESAELMAKANIGFALGGQGNIQAAVPYLDEVIAKFRDAGNLQALSGMLDEKAALLARLGLHKESMAVLREQQTLERKQFTVSRDNAVAAMQEKFAQGENRRRIEQLQEETRLKDADIRNRKLKQVALGLVALLMLVVGGFLLVLYRRAGRSNRQLRELNARLEYHAVRDPLTGLYNRRSFVEKMRSRATAALVERRQAPAQTSDIFMILDIDHFKRINDNWGHAAGDTVLVEVAQRLQAAVRERDTVLRWGGEEFVIHSCGPGGGAAAALAARILNVIGSAPIRAGNTELNVTASAGLIELPLAGMPEPALDWERAIALADAALYRAKAAGRNRCCHLLGLSDPRAAADLVDGDAAAALALLQVATIDGPGRQP